MASTSRAASPTVISVERETARDLKPWPAVRRNSRKLMNNLAVETKLATIALTPLVGAEVKSTQPQFVYRHEWRPGDLLIWDNTGTMHRVQPYDPASRLMHRTTLAGEEALA